MFMSKKQSNCICMLLTIHLLVIYLSIIPNLLAANRGTLVGAIVAHRMEPSLNLRWLSPSTSSMQKVVVLVRNWWGMQSRRSGEIGNSNRILGSHQIKWCFLWIIFAYLSVVMSINNHFHSSFGLDRCWTTRNGFNYHAIMLATSSVMRAKQGSLITWLHLRNWMLNFATPLLAF